MGGAVKCLDLSLINSTLSSCDTRKQGGIPDNSSQILDGKAIKAVRGGVYYDVYCMGYVYMNIDMYISKYYMYLIFVLAYL